jgi:hypothetical protein
LKYSLVKFAPLITKGRVFVYSYVEVVYDGEKKRPTGNIVVLLRWFGGVFCVTVGVQGNSVHNMF